MFTSSVLTKTFQLSAVAMALALAGCGGGGGGHNDTVQPAVTGGSGSTSGSGSTAAAVNSSALTLTDVSGNATTTISAAGATAKVKITDASGKGISGALVTFAGTGVTFGTTNGAVLTNANGEASISVKPTSATDTGSYSMTASATYNGTTATSTAFNYSLQAANTSISDMTLASSSLASGGSTNITLTTKDASTNSILNDVGVVFTTTCGTFTSDSVTSSSQGNVTTTYKAVDANGNLCSGPQTITATTANGTTQTINVTIAAVQANSIVYTTTNPVQLGIKGSGSSTSGQVEFTVYANGVPAANQNVVVSKTLAPLDFSFVTLNNTTDQVVKSDSNGKVIVNIYPGTIPGPVELKASLQSDTSVSALSKNVSIATGRASQAGFSISLSKNVLALNVDGDTTSVTARIVDRLGNAVPDGTVVSFLAEGGAITPSCATSSGVCSVTFTTQNPRPADGRVTIIAYLEGDKSYTDTNGDNQYTAGVDTLTNNIGDFFRDDNEDNLFNTGEFIYKRGASGTCGTSTFNQPNVPGTCDTNLSATLRYETVLGLASNTPTFDVLPPSLPSTTSSYSFKMYGDNAKTIPMAAGTTISVSAKDNTSYSRTIADISSETDMNKTFQVNGSQPNMPVTITIGQYTLTQIADSSGSATFQTQVPKSNTNAATIVTTDATCTAVLVAGNVTLPALTNLQSKLVNYVDSQGVQKQKYVVGDESVNYTFTLKDCRSTDEVKITVTTPSPDAGTQTYTIPIVNP